MLDRSNLSTKVFVPKTSSKIYSSLKNQNTYIVTGVRTQLRLEQVDRHVLFLE